VRIARIQTTVVSLPLEAPYVWAPGHYTGTSKTIVEVETSDGMVGLGEAPAPGDARVIDEDIAPRLIGEDPQDLERCWRKTLPPLEYRDTDALAEVMRAYGGVEIALWDLMGKERNLPLYQLLGGAARKEIAFSEYFSARLPRNGHGGETTPLDVAEYCARMVEEFDSPVFEGKVAHTSLAFDLEMVKEVRSAIGPDRHLRIDANMGWSLATAREALRRMAPYNLRNVEDPVYPLQEMVKLRTNSDTPFSSHTADLRLIVQLGTPDTVVQNIAALGGIRPTTSFIAACAAMGVGFWFYSGDTGIGTAAYLHLTASKGTL
jgi:glucarate dehydratase